MATGDGPCVLVGREPKDRVSFNHCSVLEPHGFTCHATAESAAFEVPLVPPEGTVIEPGGFLEMRGRVVVPDELSSSVVLAARLSVAIADPNAPPAERLVVTKLLGTLADGPSAYAVAAPPDVRMNAASLDFGRAAVGSAGFEAGVWVVGDPWLPEAFIETALSPACGTSVTLAPGGGGVVPSTGRRLSLWVGPTAVPDACTLDIAVLGGAARHVPLRLSPGSGTERIEALTATTVTHDLIVAVDDSGSMHGLEQRVLELVTALSTNVIGSGGRIAIDSVDRYAAGVAPTFAQGTLPSIHAVPFARADAARLEPTAAAVTRAIEAASDAGLLSPFADTDVVVIGNEDDGSPADVFFYDARINGASPETRVHAIVPQSNFDTCGLGSVATNRLLALTHETGGTVSDLCAETADEVAERVAPEASSVRSRVRLAATPSAGTWITVRAPRCTYDVVASGTRALDVDESCASPGELVVVEYVVPAF